MDVKPGEEGVDVFTIEKKKKSNQRTSTTALTEKKLTVVTRGF